LLRPIASSTPPPPDLVAAFKGRGIDTEKEWMQLDGGNTDRTVRRKCGRKGKGIDIHPICGPPNFKAVLMAML